MPKSPLGKPAGHLRIVNYLIVFACLAVCNVIVWIHFFHPSPPATPQRNGFDKPLSSLLGVEFSLSSSEPSEQSMALWELELRADRMYTSEARELVNSYATLPQDSVRKDRLKRIMRNCSVVAEAFLLQRALQCTVHPCEPSVAQGSLYALALLKLKSSDYDAFDLYVLHGYPCDAALRAELEQLLAETISKRGLNETASFGGTLNDSHMKAKRMRI